MFHIHIHRRRHMGLVHSSFKAFRYRLWRPIRAIRAMGTDFSMTFEFEFSRDCQISTCALPSIRSIPLPHLRQGLTLIFYQATIVAQRPFTTMAIIEEIFEEETPQTKTAHQDAKVEELNIATSMEKLELTEDDVGCICVHFISDLHA